MQKSASPQIRRRLDMLDGLRGLSIVLVFLNHIDSGHIIKALPPSLHIVGQFFFSSGTLGVSFFFILSGFLMAYLYENPLPMEFIEKRYARIFPPFLTMVFCMAIFRLAPHISLFLRVALILGTALVTSALWTYVVEKFKSGKVFIRLFLLVQCLVAVWYGFIISRKPVAWFSSLPFTLKEGTISAVNATLTLPLGDYIPMLDGVYWSLVPEVLFYLIYPFLIAPNAQKIAKKSKTFILIVLASLIPYFFGTSLMLKHLRGLSMLYIEFFIYFFSGIAVAYFVKRNKNIHLPQVIKKLFSPYLFFLFLFCSFLLLGSTTNIARLLRILLAVPYGLIVWGIVDTKTSLSAFFSSRILVFLGSISYSMYITHTAIVDGMHLVYRPTNLLTNILFLIFTSIIFFGVAYAFHLIIETLYFKYKGKSSRETPHPFKKGKIVNVAFVLFSVVLIFSAYTSNYNFFSSEKTYTQKDISLSVSRKNDTIALSEKPLLFSFVSRENNLGIVTLHLTNEINNNKKNIIHTNNSPKFVIRIKEDGSNIWYALQETPPAVIGDSSSYPFGFPTIPESKNKKYILSLSVENQDNSTQLVLHTSPFIIKTVHQLQKKELLSHPLLLTSHISQKMSAIFNNAEAYIVTACTAPLLILVLFLLF